MNKPFIVAEMSANHLGSFDRAMAIVEAAAKAGADAVKLQTWLQDTMCVDPSYVLAHGPWAGRSLVDLYREAYTPWEWHKPIFDRCKELGMVGFSAPFDKESVDFLETLDCPIYKIASFEMIDEQLVERVSATGKPVIVSTGMASKEEINQVVEILHWKDTPWAVLLKCTSSYPSDASQANLATMVEMIHPKFPWQDIRFGLSDHSCGIGVAVAAAALGASVIEKHFTLSRSDGGLDAGFSVEPDEFAQMVVECRRAVAAIGTVKYGCGPNESTELRRSLWFVKDLSAGERITPDHIRAARPASGIEPKYIDQVIGKVAHRSIKSGTPVTWEMLA